ncbi:MAG: serine/threonine protein kinase [Sandaracinaceae bacterium]|nr:serine/threonine protein kinase [Sandaracinaceae bacterium]
MSLPAHASPKDDDADPAGLVGRVLADRYRVTGLLGVGGIGRVYRAEHLVLRRQVALKVLLVHYQCVPELQRRFEREAMALAALAHPNIVTIIDFVSSRDATFLVMELLEGEELDALLSRGPLSARDAFAVMEQILSSLAYAHERDVIHRDLKPQNVIVRRLPGGRLHATMLDFGLAKFMDGSGPGQNLTKTGLVVGTPAYMAPEQASGAHADRRADVYAAGIMFFRAPRGQPPLRGLRGHRAPPAAPARAPRPRWPRAARGRRSRPSSRRSSRGRSRRTAPIATRTPGRCSTPSSRCRRARSPPGARAARAAPPRARPPTRSRARPSPPP